MRILVLAFTAVALLTGSPARAAEKRTAPAAKVKKAAPISDAACRASCTASCADWEDETGACRDDTVGGGSTGFPLQRCADVARTDYGTRAACMVNCSAKNCKRPCIERCLRGEPFGIASTPAPRPTPTPIAAESEEALAKRVDAALEACSVAHKACLGPCFPNDVDVIPGCGEKCKTEQDHCEWLVVNGTPKTDEARQDEADLLERGHQNELAATEDQERRNARTIELRNEARKLSDDTKRERSELPARTQQAVQDTIDSVKATSDRFAAAKAKEDANYRAALESQKAAQKAQQAKAAADQEKAKSDRDAAEKEKKRVADEKRISDEKAKSDQKRIADAKQKELATRAACPKWTGAYTIYSSAFNSLDLDRRLIEVVTTKPEWDKMKKEIASRINGPSVRQWNEHRESSKEFVSWANTAALACTGLTDRCGSVPRSLEFAVISVNTTCTAYDTNRECLGSLDSLIDEATRSNEFAICAQAFVHDFRNPPPN